MNNNKNPECVYCNSTETGFFLKNNAFSYFKCKDCNLVFLFPQSSEKHTLFSNKRMYGERNKIVEYFKREKYYQGVSSRIIKQIKKYQKKGKLLDVGSSYGLFLNEARRAGFDVFGVEKEKEATDYSKKRFNLKIFNNYFENLKGGQYDIVSFIDVLEHLPNLKLVLAKTKKLLKSDGILFIQCPNLQSLVFKLTKEKWNWLLPNVHLYHFSIKSLKKVLEENGFRVLSVKTYDNVSEFAYNLIDVLGIKKVPQNFLKKLFWKSLRIFFLVILQLSFVWSYFGYGGSINIIAKKNNH